MTKTHDRMVRDRRELVSLLDEFKRMPFLRRQGVALIAPLRLRAFIKEEIFWEYEHSTGRVIPGEISSTDFLEAIDMSGASRLVTSFSAYGEDRKIDTSGWKDWFLKKTSGKFLIPDTNFILRHYGSKVLSRLLGSDFETLRFRIPRLVVLEIERRGNAKKPKETEPGRNKRLAFYAACEINLLRQKFAADPLRFDMLAPLDAALLDGFSDFAGTQFVDALIRQEIHDVMHSGFLGEPKNVLFLTCDLMNALAGEAEGISSCYFNRLPQDSFFIDSDNSEQLSDLIIATAMLFKETRLDVILEGDTVHRSSIIRGMWGSKTTSQWYSDCIEETPLNLKS